MMKNKTATTEPIVVPRCRLAFWRILNCFYSIIVDGRCSILSVPSGLAEIKVKHPLHEITTLFRSRLISHTRLPSIFRTSSISLTSLYR